MENVYIYIDFLNKYKFISFVCVLIVIICYHYYNCIVIMQSNNEITRAIRMRNINLTLIYFKDYPNTLYVYIYIFIVILINSLIHYIPLNIRGVYVFDK